jgi:hypothetical protein
MLGWHFEVVSLRCRIRAKCHASWGLSDAKQSGRRKDVASGVAQRTKGLAIGHFVFVFCVLAVKLG